MTAEADYNHGLTGSAAATSGVLAVSPSVPKLRIMLGRRIAHYLILEELGRGGMGCVYKARDTKLGRVAALKVLSSEKKIEDNNKKRFLQEARLASALNHPHIVTIYDIVEDNGVDCIVMEYVAGRTLARLIQERELPLAGCMHLARQIGDALAAAHSAGIIHRDLKPGNVMVSDGGEVKVLDFGLAKFTTSEPGTNLDAPTLATPMTNVGTILGTPNYMSPEQAQGQPLDSRSDIFSFGVLLYHLLTRALPFEGSHATAVLHELIYADPKPVSELRPDVPLGLEAIVSRSLAKKPEDRYQNASELNAELDTLSMEMGVPLSLSSTALQAAEGRSARKWRRAVLAILLAVAATGLLALLSPQVRRQISYLLPPAAVSESLQDYQIYQLGLQFLERHDIPGNLDRAIDAFNRTIALNERNAAAHAGLALSYRARYWEQHDKVWLDLALQNARKAVQLNGHLALARVSLGSALTEQGSYEEALAQFTEALTIDPLNAMAYRELGNLELEQKEMEQAEKSYQKAIDLEPDSWSGFARLGTLYYRTGRYTESERAFLKTLELAPDSPRAHRNLAAAYARQNRLEEAAASLQKALEIDPAPSVYTNLGWIYFGQGLYEKAVSAFERAVELGPNDYLRWGNLGDAYRLTAGKENEARRAYQRAVELVRAELQSKPDDATRRSRLAVYLAARGDAAEAVSELEQVQTQTEKDASLCWRLAVAYELLGRREEALRWLEAALKAGYPPEEIERDPEFLRLRNDLRYHQLTLNLSSKQ